MKIVFDSNVWEKVVDSEAEPYRTINMKIRGNLLVPFICEAAISLEQIPKMHRAGFFKTYKPKFEFKDTQSVDNRVCTEFSISPNNELHPGLPEVLISKLALAQRLGFKVIHMNRFGTVRTNEIPKDMYVQFDENGGFWRRAELFSECVKFIEKMGGGQSKYSRFKQEFGLSDGTLQIPENKRNAFIKAIAEWSDGDSIAACYSMGIHLFCTDDRGQNAGCSSVFFPDNIKKISERFEVEVISSARAAEL
ncbi:hypothetical protein Cpar_1764 [Chlorobaculum parvum NCIB 8327]|uniref:Uncharacterized protein n=1 Tax=Chlorobaculum parvum (strain DSM 263 / NCIMB 8327) TaxID=517417 RepID=B3QQF3_CHLP8|nr:hypothetical protein [Chlorobaculum parvum]ACF12156.1 hypothetical protein Cpar_1764 [Chlorobaculum parvum NCIB 8327]